MRTKVRLTFILGLVTMFLSMFCGSAAAWHGSADNETPNDVHNGCTFYWAKQMGFNVEEATTIYQATDSVDTDLLGKFSEKDWHLGSKWEITTSPDQIEKPTSDPLTWRLKEPAPFKTYTLADRNDSRIQHADQELEVAKLYISKVPYLSGADQSAARHSALVHLGVGLHALQDYYAHMNAGANSTDSFDLYHHGESGRLVEVYDSNYNYLETTWLDGENKWSLSPTPLYDDVLYDYVKTYKSDGTLFEGWVKRSSREENSRFIATQQATYDYLYKFLTFGYGNIYDGSNVKTNIITDGFGSDSGRWEYIGYAQLWSGSAELTQDLFNQAGVIWLKDEVRPPFTISFSYELNHSGGDGFVFMFCKDKNYLPASGGSLGFEPAVGSVSAKGYGIEFDNYYSSLLFPDNEWDPQTKHVALIKDSPQNHLVFSAADDKLFDGNVHSVRIDVKESSLDVYVDGSLILTSTNQLIDTTFGGIGFAASTGGTHDCYEIDNVSIDKIEPILYGDANGDKTVDVGDAILVLRNIVGLETNLQPQQLQAANVSADTAVDVGDAMLILQKIVGLIPKFPVEQ